MKGNNEIENAPVLSAVEDVLGRVPEGGVIELLLPRPLRARDAAVEAQLGHGTGVVLRKRKVTKFYFNLGNNVCVGKGGIRIMTCSVGNEHRAFCLYLVHAKGGSDVLGRAGAKARHQVVGVLVSAALIGFRIHTTFHYMVKKGEKYLRWRQPAWRKSLGSRQRPRGRGQSRTGQYPWKRGSEEKRKVLFLL